MTRRHHRHHDDDEDHPHIVADGQRVRVPLFAMDSSMDPVQRAIAAHLHDGHGGGIGHRPGHIVSGASEALDARRRMYDEYDARKATEYLGADRESREGTICTVRRNGICVTDDEDLRDALPTRDSTMTLDAMEAQHRRNMADIYAAYDARICEMWRNP